MNGIVISLVVAAAATTVPLTSAPRATTAPAVRYESPASETTAGSAEEPDEQARSGPQAPTAQQSDRHEAAAAFDGEWRGDAICGRSVVPVRLSLQQHASQVRGSALVDGRTQAVAGAAAGDFVAVRGERGAPTLKVDASLHPSDGTIAVAMYADGAVCSAKLRRAPVE